MLAAIELDSDSGLETNKVADERFDLMLATELEASQLAFAEMTPENSLGLRGVASEMTCKVQHADMLAYL